MTRIIPCLWLKDAQHIASPNFDCRPVGTTIDTMVIHSISLPPGFYKGDYVEQFFQNKLNICEDDYFRQIQHLKVSSHLYIKREGALIQFVDLYHRAWHAGKSNLNGRHRVNDFSIGIELQGTDTDIFTNEQYQVLNSLIQTIRANFTELKYIVAHSDIAPMRKTDPGKGFDWQKIKL